MVWHSPLSGGWARTTPALTDGRARSRRASGPERPVARHPLPAGAHDVAHYDDPFRVMTNALPASGGCRSAPPPATNGHAAGLKSRVRVPWSERSPRSEGHVLLQPGRAHGSAFMALKETPDSFVGLFRPKAWPSIAGGGAPPPPEGRSRPRGGPDPVGVIANRPRVPARAGAAGAHDASHYDDPFRVMTNALPASGRVAPLHPRLRTGRPPA